ncbi:helicase-like transcription factor CHR28 isoform X2 [Apium graveolens]|uniref:helicase-like transcription factor CHR28 isoform X2 n=1 Tax=Apium graveolens TaxID=4045 RepID=UPI003D7B52B7
MPDHDNPIRNLTRRCLSLLTGLLSTVLPCYSQLEEGFSSNSKVVKKALVMANETIDISSSSDGWDLEAHESFVDDSVTSAPLRRLPQWAVSAATSSVANAGPSRKNTFRVSTFNGNVSNPGHHNQFGTDHGRQSVKAPYQTSNPNGSSSHDNGQHLYGQVSKRILPQSFMPHVKGSNNLVGNLGSSHMREAYARSYPAQGISNHVKNQIGGDCDDDVLMYDKNGTLILPKPLMPRISPSIAHHTTSADPSSRSGAGGERYGEYDERLIYQAALQDLNQPKAEASLPDGLLSVSLLKHQKIALAWMLQKEKSYCCSGGFLADDQGLGKTISMIALIQYQKFIQSISKSEDLSQQTTEALNLDDDEENATNDLEKVKQDEDSRDLILIPEASTSTRNIQSRRPQAGTLVVCPASVLRQWARELEEKVAEEAKLCVLIYHGSSRTKDPVELAKYDVVVTTYAIVANEVPPTSGDDEDQNKKNMENCGLISDFSGNNKRKQKTHASKKRKKARKGIDSSSIDSDCGTLAKVRWLRVILDEAQTIKNHRTQVARACAGFKAKSRWCLSGTPIQNTIDDLFSYFRFLKYDPYTTHKSFCTTLKNPISRDSVQGYKKLYAVLRAVMLRRTKGTYIDGEPIIRLPRKTINLIPSEFCKEERDFYKELEASSLSQFKAYAAAGTLNQNYANILLMLLRLRQACDHPLLVKGFSSESTGRDSVQMAKNLPRDMLINLLKHLDTSSAICCVCNDPPEDAIVTMCGHVFCYQCVSEYLRGDENTCPSHECKELLGPDVVFSKATLRRCLYGNDHLDVSLPSEPNKSLILENGYISSKIKAAMEILQSHCKSNNACLQPHGIVGQSASSSRGKETCDSVCSVVKVTNTTAWSDAQTEAPKKAIVFSQWTGMLDLVEKSLNQSALRYRRLDGTMTLSARDKAVKEFNNDPEVTVMLMSLKAGNLGLNMVAATHVVLLDLWWNPTTEDQAIDRAHRIGQTQPVTVSRLTIKNTVEERILALQEEKRKMVASAFGEDQSGGSGTRLTVEDLRFLFMGKQ